MVLKIKNSLTGVQSRLVLSDEIRFVQSQIDGVIFTRDYFDFNVMAVVAMVCCEMFFYRRVVVGQVFFCSIM